MIAEACIVGVPFDRAIRSDDPDEQDLIERVRLAGVGVIDDLLTNLARKIVKEESDAQERGRRKG